ncbi:chloride channel protein [Kosakonia pseudosacchari]|uniref:Chloride channel protein n=2 Tax=Kosakonia pseudosacchari TaxID=1646340 RepID=A0ABX4IWR6_9ENTR|nr:chloride channel protein [Kosakonia pseudosacchari]
MLKGSSFLWNNNPKNKDADKNTMREIPDSGWQRRWLALLLTGLLSGAAGMLIALLLHAIQHLAFGYSQQSLIGGAPFLQGVTDASALRRFTSLAAAGVVAGWGWWLLARYAKKRVSVVAALKDVQRPMPAFTTLTHALLQVVTVAMGSPLGRESAPREVGALFGKRVARHIGLNAQETRLLIACGAGAGLAAVYNVPLAGAIFTLEVLLVTISWDAVIAAIVTCALAAFVASLVLGNERQYLFTAPTAPLSLIIWATLSGPLFGYAASLFRRMTKSARAQVKSNWQMPVFCFIAFACLGLLAIWFPQLPGNGRGPVQLSFGGDVTLPLAAMLIGLKVLSIWMVLRSGAEGGLLTPGLAIGALLGALMFLLVGQFFPDGSMAEFALTGGAAFLASSMQMPLTAIVLLLEFTGMDFSFFVPLTLCVAGAYMTCRYCE